MEKMKYATVSALLTLVGAAVLGGLVSIAAYALMMSQGSTSAHAMKNALIYGVIAVLVFGYRYYIHRLITPKGVGTKQEKKR